MKRDIVPVRTDMTGTYMLADYSQPRDPAVDAIRRLRHALYAYHTPNVPDESDPAGVVEVAIRRLGELYLVATKGP